MMRRSFIALLAATLACTEAFTSSTGAFGLNRSKQNEMIRCQAVSFDTSGMWNAGLSYGKGEFKFYKSLEEWMKPFPEEDREAEEVPEEVWKPLGS